MKHKNYLQYKCKCGFEIEIFTVERDREMAQLPADIRHMIEAVADGLPKLPGLN